jgi:hypothetical protein
MLEDLQAQTHTLTNRLEALRSELKECSGELYRGCWLDSATNSTGKRYTRLRWFTSLKPKRKGCRILRGEELATATKAIALWQEYERVEAALNRLNEAWASIEAKASRRLPGKTQTAPTPGKSLASVQEWQPADTFTHQGKSFELMQQQPRALPASGERREECVRVDDTPLANAGGERRGDGGNEQLSIGLARNLPLQPPNQLSNNIGLGSA